MVQTNLKYVCGDVRVWGAVYGVSGAVMCVGGDWFGMWERGKSLKYLCVDIRMWGVSQAGYSWGWMLMSHAEAVHVVCECVGRGEEADE